ncbi:uncharacterized protein B0I36DRAFT_315579 [Microdochium trichocladiopsis]|uniref:Protein ECM13 n=1 Tax=Microdochium trichocladiopsis TaxID=1682393 RepID=A0A9P8YF08_9PEZI|nr:uncharacterized protein B0I36DRAFT_315579 [Microdochium trichocladiopsis]KAH7038118.1 hypothetical protein B0I36DRAFT_315579 [Microdochium trichocladiopsis]
MVSTVFSSSPFNPSTTSTRPQASPKMSITQTYFLAHKARAKLSHEAARPDHNLRLLVGHANLLDSLMLDLADAEREQESWFNQSVRGASTPSKTADRHVQWADSIVEEEDWEADSSDSDSDFDDEEEEDVEMADAIPLRRLAPASPQIQTHELEEEEDDEEDYESLALTRSPSHVTSPPELDLDSDSSEDESMPPSPPTASFPAFAKETSQKPRETTVTETPLFDSQDEDEEQDITDNHKASFYQDGFYLPARNPARLVSTISVY